MQMLTIGNLFGSFKVIFLLAFGCLPSTDFQPLTFPRSPLSPSEAYWIFGKHLQMTFADLFAKTGDSPIAA